MKILFYISTIARGGAERVITNLANQFCTDGYQVVLVTILSQTNEYDVLPNVKRIVLEKGSDTCPSLLKRNLARARKLRCVLTKERPDLAVAFMAAPNIHLLLASLGLTMKKVISIRNDPTKEYSSSIMIRIFLNKFFLLANHIVFQTQDAQNWFSVKIRRKSSIVWNQVDKRFFETTFTGDRKNIVSVGRLCHQKNHLLLIDAFAKICDRTNESLYIYGEGPMRAELENHIRMLGLERRIFLPGIKPEISKEICSAKLFVLSSRYEGMPNALMEAMALGIPCVSTDCPCGGPKALFENLENGILVPNGDVDSLAIVIEAVLQDSELQKALSLKARERAIGFTSEKVFSQWKGLFLHVLQKHAAREMLNAK